MPGNTIIGDSNSPKERLKSKIRNALTWTFLRRWLVYFGEESSKTYLWVIPLSAFVLGVLNSYLGTSLALNSTLFLFYLISSSYAVAHLLYGLLCPPEIRGLISTEDWADKTLKRKKQLIEMFELEKKLRETFFSLIDLQIEYYLKHKNVEPDLMQEHSEGLKNSFKGMMAPALESISEFTEDLKSQSHRRFDELNISFMPFRYFAFFFIILTMVGSVTEVTLSFSDVLHATFNIGH